MLWVTAYWAPSWWRELIKTVVHLITTFLLSYPPQPLKSRATWSLLGEVCSVFSWLHSSNVTVMVTSGAQWPRGPVSSYARQWNENEVLMTCMRQISVVPWVLTGGGVRLSLPRAVWWQGQGQSDGGNRSRASPSKQAGGTGESWSECLKNRTWGNKQSYWNQKWTLEWGQQLNLRRLSCQPVV